MNLGLKDKVAVITGGASGIGRSTALHFAEEGTRVFLLDVQEERLREVAEDVTAAGGEAAVRVLDVTDYDACREAMEQASGHFGGIDVLVNSAGIAGPLTFFAEEGPEHWTDLLAINLQGVIHCSRAATDHLIARGSGRIVSLASEAGRANEKRMAVYGATKGGVISLTRGLACELGRHNITVNAVCPGVTKTPMTDYVDEEMERRSSAFYPMGRLGEPEDIAAMIVFLCSDRTSWVTGQAVCVSGGFGRA